MEESILSKLKFERIFRIKKLENGTYNFKEKCDGYFQVDLPKEEVQQLILELQELIKWKRKPTL